VANAAFWRMEAQGRIGTDPRLARPLNRLYGGFAFWLSLPFLLVGTAVLTGNATSSFDFVTFDAENPYNVGWWALIFGEDALFIYWVFWRAGDEKLSLHTELLDARPKFQVAVKIVAVALPVIHFLHATFSPHFGQFSGANGA